MFCSIPEYFHTRVLHNIIFLQETVYTTSGLHIYLFMLNDIQVHLAEVLKRLMVTGIFPYASHMCDSKWKQKSKILRRIGTLLQQWIIKTLPQNSTGLKLLSSNPLSFSHFLSLMYSSLWLQLTKNKKRWDSCY